MAMYIPKINRRPHLFLSHNKKDKDFVRQLADDLNVCEVDVWFDEWEIAAGDSIINLVTEGLEKSQFISILLSQAYLKANWTIEELNAALSRQIETKTKVILPLLIEEVKIPILLRDKLYINFQENYHHSLTMLVGLIHQIDKKTLSFAIRKMNPVSLEEVLNTLAYCGKDPFMIIPEDVFNEIAATGKAEVEGNSLRFLTDTFSSADYLSQRAIDYINRVRIGISRDPRSVWIH